MARLTLTRDVTREECHWLDRDFAKGEHVYSFHKYTYGCVSGSGRAVSLVDDEYPFFELPRAALEASNA